MFVVFAKLMDPEVGAGGGGGAGGEAAGGAAGGNGAAGAQVPAGTQPSGKGGAGAAGVVAESKATPEFHEWEEPGEGGKPVKRRASIAAMTAAFRREQVTNRRAQEAQAREERALKAEQAQAQLDELRAKGDLHSLLGPNFKGNRAEAYAKALRAELDREKQMADPNQKALLEKAEENDKLRSELDGIKAATYKQKFDAEVERRLEAKSERYMKALETSKLPKNDITLMLMAGAERSNQESGLGLTDEQLATETRRSATEMVDSIGDGMTPIQAVEAFPKLTKLIHRGLVEQANGRRNGTQAKQVQPKEKREANGTEKSAEPTISDAAAIRKKTGVFGLI